MADQRKRALARLVDAQKNLGNALHAIGLDYASGKHSKSVLLIEQAMNLIREAGETLGETWRTGR